MIIIIIIIIKEESRDIRTRIQIHCWCICVGLSVLVCWCACQHILGASAHQHELILHTPEVFTQSWAQEPSLCISLHQEKMVEIGPWSEQIQLKKSLWQHCGWGSRLSGVLCFLIPALYPPSPAFHTENSRDLGDFPWSSFSFSTGLDHCLMVPSRE